MKTDFLTKLQRVQKLHKQFPQLAAVTAVNFSKERFVKKNWLGTNYKKWEPKKQNSKGSLMVKSGRLKRSIRKLKVTRNSVTIGTDVPYAEIHNEGGTISKTTTVKQHTRKRKGRVESVRSHSRTTNTTMPQRRFIGAPPALTKRIERMLTKKLTEALK